jgi:hypothetical protein
MRQELGIETVGNRLIPASLAVAARVKCGSSDHIRESLPVQINTEALQRKAAAR